MRQESCTSSELKSENHVKETLSLGSIWPTASGTHHLHKLFLNLLKPTSHVMHHQFNNQLLYALPTLYLCVLYLSENKQRLVPITALTDWFL